MGSFVVEVINLVQRDARRNGDQSTGCYSALWSLGIATLGTHATTSQSHCVDGVCGLDAEQVRVSCEGLGSQTLQLGNNKTPVDEEAKWRVRNSPFQGIVTVKQWAIVTTPNEVHAPPASLPGPAPQHFGQPPGHIMATPHYA